MTKKQILKALDGLTILDARANEVTLLGEMQFDEAARRIEALGESFHGYRTGAWHDDAREYEWVLMIGKAPSGYAYECDYCDFASIHHY